MDKHSYDLFSISKINFPKRKTHTQTQIAIRYKTTQ